MTHIPDVLNKFEAEILSDWIALQKDATGPLAADPKQTETSRRFLRLFREAAQSGDLDRLEAAEWSAVREILQDLSTDRAALGYSPSETARVIFSLKQPLFERLRQKLRQEPEALADDLLRVTKILDALGLFTMEVYLERREAVILRQQQEMVELSTPVVELWTGILALPLIGTLDSHRTQTVMESLLEKIVQTGSSMAIIDITGVPTVDTLVAQHLLKTVAAARLMGADCIISGIRPQIAQTIVHLGVNLGDVTTKASLSSAFALALGRHGLAVQKA